MRAFKENIIFKFKAMADKDGFGQSEMQKARNTQRMLADEFKNMQIGNEAVDRTADNLSSASTKFSQYDPKIRKTKLLV